MRSHYLVVPLFMLGSVLLAQTASPPATNTSSSGGIGPAAVWQIPPDFLKNAHAACDNAKQPPSFEECFIDEMPKAGAPPDALAFTRDLYKAKQQVGIMGALHDFGPVALAWVVYPLRANDNNGILIVNSKPNFLDVDDMKNLDTAAVQQNPTFLEYKKTNPKLDVWPGDRSGANVFVQYALNYAADKPDDVRFLFSYPLIDGCHACARHGVANFWWDFDSKGTFLGTKLISVSPVPPPLKRARPKPPTGPGSPTPGTPQAAPGTTPPQPGAGAPEPPQAPPAPK